MLHADHVQVIAWALRQKDSIHAAGCELFAITLEVQPSLKVEDVRLMQVETRTCSYCQYARIPFGDHSYFPTSVHQLYAACSASLRFCCQIL